MNEKKEILNQINSFKNYIINDINNDNIINIDKVENNLIYINNLEMPEPRNSTAPNDGNKKIK